MNQIKVVFQRNFVVTELAGGQREFSVNELVEATGLNVNDAGDSELITAVERFLDVPEGALGRMDVTRPATGNILISDKARFGNDGKKRGPHD